VKEAIEDVLKEFPSVQFEVLTFLGDRIGETLTGETRRGREHLRR